MKKQHDGNYYLARKSKLLNEFLNVTERMRTTFVSTYGDQPAEAIIEDARSAYEDLIPELPYIGGDKNPFTKNLIGTVWYLAIYRALEKHGVTAEEAGKVLYDGAEAYLSSLSWLSRLGIRLLWRVWFTRLGRKFVERQAKESQKRRYPDDFVFSYVEGDGVEFDFGIDYIECAACKFFHKQNLDELMPFVCY